MSTVRILPAVNLWKAGRNWWSGSLMFRWLLTKAIYITFQPDLHGIHHHLFHLLKRRKKVFIHLPLIRKHFLQCNYYFIKHSIEYWQFMQYLLKNTEGLFGTFWRYHSILNTKQSTTNKTQTLGLKKQNLLQKNSPANSTPCFSTFSTNFRCFLHMVWLQGAAATDTAWVYVLTWTDQISLLTVFFYVPMNLWYLQCVSVLTFTHKLQQWNCMGWKRWPLVTKQVSVGCLGPRGLDRGLGAGSSTGNARPPGHSCK